MTASIDAPDTIDSEGLLNLIDQIITELKAEFVDRDEVIHVLIVGLLAEQHVLLHGEPGVAKSKVVDRLFLRIDAVRYGKFPMNRLMSADDLFGPIDVAGYAEEGRFRRLLEGYLGDCEYANLEEIFKAGPATLGLLLPAMNERNIRNDGAVIPIPLKTVMCSSNEFPKDELTQPLYDRIPLRLEILGPPDRASMQQMLCLPVEMPKCSPVITGDQLSLIQDQVRSMPFHEHVAEKLAELYFDLLAEGVRPSPRRLDWMRRAMQAEAWLDGADLVTVDHLGICKHGLWDAPSHIDTVFECVNKLANPLERRTLKLIDDIAVVSRDLPKAIAATSKEDQEALGMEIYEKLKDAATELTQIEEEGSGGRQQRHLIDSARQTLRVNLRQLLRDIMKVPADQIEALAGKL